MPPTVLTVQTVSMAGITPTYAAATVTDGDDFANDGNTYVEVKNTGTQKTLTITTPATVRGVAIADLAITIPATTGDVKIGPFPPEIFNDGNGRVHTLLDAVTGATIGAFKVRPA